MTNFKLSSDKINEKKMNFKMKKLQKKIVENQNLFSSSVDPYDRPLKWWEKEFIKYSFSNPPVRSRLEMLMGSNVVRLTDRRYMLRLMEKINQDYEKNQQCRIEERKKNELMRTKMMIVNRLIPVQEAPIEIKKYPLFQLYLYCDSIIREKRKKRSTKQIKIAQSLYRLLYPVKVEEETKNQEKYAYMKRVHIDGVPELIPLTSEEVAAIELENEATKDIENGYMLPQEEYDRLHYETNEIKEFRDAQNVEDMYARAHEILGILYSYIDDGRYKKPGHPEKIIKSESDIEKNEEIIEDTDGKI
ncbi:uncharacterized protein LOC122851821 isoform X1 [Aphidius gifuensis]|uniref:uncharacterized protein LOC122851821 isoform X1 n=1 Tax=Aphidius gifuensis TaxID=684658 RepID=UPI001CDCBFF1|nr:uncharacterized protein LOC122851821 isoform X1 [Aphidius gifuensis]